MNHHCKYCGRPITHNTLGWAAAGVPNVWRCSSERPGHGWISIHDHQPYDTFEELALQSIEQKGTS